MIQRRESCSMPHARTRKNRHAIPGLDGVTGGKGEMNKLLIIKACAWQFLKEVEATSATTMHVLFFVVVVISVFQCCPL